MPTNYPIRSYNIYYNSTTKRGGILLDLVNNDQPDIRIDLSETEISAVIAIINAGPKPYYDRGFIGNSNRNEQ